MTAVEFLMINIFPFKYRDNEEISHILNILEEAKEMERLQLKDAQSYAISNADMTNNRGYFDCYNWYNETYGSNGSDDTSFQTISEKWKEYQDWLNEIPEISDEEIEKEARKLANIEHNRPLDLEERYYKDYQKYDGIVIGMKWYREQLKKKQ